MSEYITEQELDIQRQTEKLMVLSAPQELVKFTDIKLLKVLLVEHLFRHKPISSLSNTFGIPTIDLKFFFNSAEAKTLLEELKTEADEDTLKDRSLNQLKAMLVEKLENLLADASTRDCIDAIERITPQVIDIERAILERENSARGGSSKSVFDISPIQDVDFTVESSTFELDAKKPDIKNIEDLGIDE